jgi:hypothetical protein
MKNKQRKAGRPRLPKSESKKKIVPVRFDSSDLQLVTHAAGARKEAISEWIRNIVRNAAERQLFQRTLHEAMERVLRDSPDCTATAAELSEAIRQRALYVRKDGAFPKPQQISARARQYPELFTTGAGFIRLAKPSSGLLQGDSSPLDFHPIEIPGEPLSATVLRERR